MPPRDLLNEKISRRSTKMVGKREHYEAQGKGLIGKKQPSKEHSFPVVKVDKKSGAVVYRDEEQLFFDQRGLGSSLFFKITKKLLHKKQNYAKFNIKGGEFMIKQISLRSPKSIIGTYKANLYEKIRNKKVEDELYKRYIMNAIREAEEDIANGGRTYTLEEWQELMRSEYNAEI